MLSFPAFIADQTIREVQTETPTPQGKEVLLRITHSGVCHSDVHGRQGHFDLGSRGKMELAAQDGAQSIVMGHEIVGEVVATGPEASDKQIGQRYVVYPWLGCGSCTRCSEDRENECTSSQNIGGKRPGGYADHVLVPDARYLVDIQGLDPAWAATLACSGLTSYSAVSKLLPLQPEAPVAIIGAGGVGLSAIAILAALGHRNTIALDLNPENLKLAAAAGAAQTFLMDQDTGASEVYKQLRVAPEAIIDFVNNSQTATLGFGWIAKAGTMIQVGLFGGEVVVPTALLALKMITLRGSYVGNLVQLQNLIELAKSGQLPQGKVASGPLSADGVRDALDALEARTASGRVVLQANHA